MLFRRLLLRFEEVALVTTIALNSADEGIGGTGGTGDPSAYSGDTTTSPLLILLSLQYGEFSFKNGCSPFGSVALSCLVKVQRYRESRELPVMMNDPKSRASVVPDTAEDISSL